jgi:hypothetical protein
VRFERGEVKVRSDDEWVMNMSAARKGLATLLSLPLLVRYGYVGRRVSVRWRGE